jgi:DMSO/TMAO reductase YedYZ molybdopterin-dependent catalytic subunit
MNRYSRSILISFVSGLAAGALAVAVSLILKETSGGLFLPELASQTLFSITPGEFESQAVENFGPLAKYSAFIGAVITNIIIFGVLGVLINKIYQRTTSVLYLRKVLISFVLSYSVFLIIALILITVIQSRSGIQILPIPLLAISLIPSQLTFALVFSSFKTTKEISQDKFQPKTGKFGESKDIDFSRRDFLRLVVSSSIALPIIFLGLNKLFSGQNEGQEEPSSLPNLLPQSGPIPKEFVDPNLKLLLASEVTPTYLFYRIDINPIVPQVDAKSWKLMIKGFVDNPLTIDYDQIRSFASIEEYVTLECISNKIGGDLIGNALWKGVPLKDLLEKAGVRPEAKYLVFRCSDGYDVGIPLERSLMDGSILAYDMNSAPLTAKHGFPVRAIVPGLYGMMNPKWLTEIELVDSVYEGYWQRLGWSNIAEDNTGSSIVIPGEAPVRQRFRKLDETNPASYGNKIPVAGIAFAGNRGITKVEVSTDGGSTWKSATIKDPLSKYTWVLWTAGYLPPDNENYKIVVRATDKNGKVQTSEMRPPFPDGATGLHHIDFARV